MRAQEIREKTSEELAKELKDLQKELFHLRFQLAINQLDNPTRIRAVKKDIARVKTIMREKELNNSADVQGK
ncbi:MAG: 50S ribosomal protein L29 [bacterium]|nr:50S ribosomal protein L29 [bacterium]